MPGNYSISREKSRHRFLGVVERQGDIQPHRISRDALPRAIPAIPRISHAAIPPMTHPQARASGAGSRSTPLCRPLSFCSPNVFLIRCDAVRGRHARPAPADSWHGRPSRSGDLHRRILLRVVQQPLPAAQDGVQRSSWNPGSAVSQGALRRFDLVVIPPAAFLGVVFHPSAGKRQRGRRAPAPVCEPLNARNPLSNFTNPSGPTVSSASF